MSELSKTEKHKELMQEIAQNAHQAGIYAYNIEEFKGKIGEHHVKIRNLTIDANKLFAEIEKEKIEADLIAKKEAEHLQLVEAANV